MIYWFYLTIAIATEIGGTIALKFSNGFTRWIPSSVCGMFYIVSFVAMSAALKKIDVGLAYAIWSGIGTAFIAVVGIVYFREPLNTLKVISLLLIIAGCVGLNLSGGGR